jgi:hypothetical protein
VLHQSSRTAGKDGQAVTISSGSFGGEQQATHLIGVRRRKNEIIAAIKEMEEKIGSAANPKPEWDDRLADLRYDLGVHQDTVTFNLVKNKRPPCHLVDDTDFVLDKETGRIEQLGYPSRGAVARIQSSGASTAASGRLSAASAIRNVYGTKFDVSPDQSSMDEEFF